MQLRNSSSPTHRKKSPMKLVMHKPAWATQKSPKRKAPTLKLVHSRPGTVSKIPHLRAH